MTHDDDDDNNNNDDDEVVSKLVKIVYYIYKPLEEKYQNSPTSAKMVAYARPIGLGLPCSESEASCLGLYHSGPSHYAAM